MKVKHKFMLYHKGIVETIKCFKFHKTTSENGVNFSLFNENGDLIISFNSNKYDNIITKTTG